MSSLNHLIALLALLYLSITTTVWEVDLFSDSACDVLATNGVKYGAGVGTICIPSGGNSYMINDDDGCVFHSWSGDDCRGSRVTGIGDSCIQDISFGSIQVVC